MRAMLHSLAAAVEAQASCTNSSRSSGSSGMGASSSSGCRPMAAAAAAVAGVRAAAGQQRRRRCQQQHVCRAEGLSYKDAGVDIDAGNELVKRIQKLNPNIGGFSGMSGSVLRATR